MQKFLVLVMAGICGAASAQTPTTNPMPDGSRDMYVGLGASVAPRWDGAREHRTTALPVLQVQWSNGVFVSGMSVGMHLSDQPAYEIGPLLNLMPRRDDSGFGASFGGVAGSKNTGLVPNNTPYTKAAENGNLLEGIAPVPARVEVGGFFNYYLSDKLRLTNGLLYGSGRDRDGLRYALDLQHLATDIAPHHSLSGSVGLSLVNRAYNDSYFGVHSDIDSKEGVADYRPGGGLKDIHASVRWNWTFSPSWMLTTLVYVSHVQADAAKSPLVQRSTNTTVSTALAYRF